MKKLRGKLNSEKGAVMVIALLFFLVCALVAAVIVAAASMNAGRIEKRYDEQKAYLAASSATQMLQKNLAGMTFEAEQTEKKYTCGSSHDDAGKGEWGQKTACKDSVYFNEFITDSAMAICKGNTTASYTTKYTLNADKLSDVTTTVNVEMFADDTNKYDVKCVIESETSGGSSYTMSLYIKASNDLLQSTQTYSKSDKHKASAGVIGGIWDEELRFYVNYYDYDVITTTLTVTWPEGTIQKGDAS